MEKPTLKVKIRDKTGKSYVRKIRKKGLVPAVLYGPHLEKSIPLEIDISDIHSLMSTLSGGERIITLEIVNQNENNKREVILKDVQHSWIKGGLQHLDFYEITRGEKISTEVPLRLVGEAPGVKKGGVIEQLVREVEIECLPENIPPHIDVDIKNLEMGDSLRIKDLNIPPGIKMLTNPEEVVVSILSPISEEEIEKLEEEKGVVAEEVEVVRKEKKEEEEKEEPKKKQE